MKLIGKVGIVIILVLGTVWARGAVDRGEEDEPGHEPVHSGKRARPRPPRRSSSWPTCTPTPPCGIATSSHVVARGHVDVPRLVEGGVALQAFTIVTKTPRRMNIESNTADTDNITLLAVAQLWPPRTWNNLTERALYQASRVTDAAARSDGRLTVVRTAADLAAFETKRASDKTAVAAFIGVEGAHALAGDLSNLDRLYEAGVRMMAPTHFFDTEIGGSAHGVSRSGLTPLGREWVARMEAKKMVIDLAHASPATLDDVLKIATRPVVVSHTGVRGTCDNQRNLLGCPARGDLGQRRGHRHRGLGNRGLRRRRACHRPRDRPCDQRGGLRTRGAGFGLRWRGHSAVRCRRACLRSRRPCSTSDWMRPPSKESWAATSDAS